MCNFLLNKLFDDRRMIVTMLSLWLGVVCIGFHHLGLLDTDYTTLGPSPHTVFLNVRLDTWRRWSMVAIFTVVNTMINDFSGDSLSPFFLNTVQDPKAKWLPYSKVTCIMITQTYTIYGTLMSVFTIHLILAQLDFVLIRLVTDLMVNVWTQTRLLRHKEYDPIKFQQVEMHGVQMGRPATGEDSAFPLMPPEEKIQSFP